MSKNIIFKIFVLLIPVFIISCSSGEDYYTPESVIEANLKYMNEEKYDEALRILNTQHGETFAGLYSDRKGDILVASKKISEARLSYQAAIDKLSKSNNYYNIVQMKLDALGDSE